MIASMRAELVERDVELARRRRGPTQQFEVAAGDRHRRAQLVRRVVDEALLALEHRAALLGAPLGDPLRLDPPARVPDDGQEQQRHQRNPYELLDRVRVRR